ncbi:hypothetical protein CAC42_6367 [Sphaceloma murrayae]|uniref:RNA polymerase II subunit B1 CTD phosphatase RPAP2 homolog n=1 Tax=Sphaceloma murrayae TaxID=2082308 RepID=A0A2K1QN21_9PEZI|nr:hypothetical protein CAC42_6367 [Sphaceloma murrayae]
MTAAAPKSILKKTAAQPRFEVPPGVNIPAPRSDAEARNLQTALLHAEQIKSQKEAQLKVLESIEALSLLPASDTPSHEEITQFKTEVSIFQPSDYSALLEERNVNGFCGYTLCGKPPKEANKGRAWLRPEGERRFCGTECARKALYVRAQLDETPAWERRAGLEAEIQLKDEAAPVVLPIRTKADDDGSAQAALANERGDKPQSKRVTMVTDEVVEKKLTGRSSGGFVKFEYDDFAHDVVEGYKVSGKKLGTSRRVEEG